MRSPTKRSVLDDLGAEITGIALPVSICMAVTVFLVRVLNPDGDSSSSTVMIASIAYDESGNPDASSGQKLGGAVLNAIIFVAVITAMTLVLFALFYYGCYKIIFAYMGFAVFDIFFLITGILIIKLLQVGDVHVDAFSFLYILWNFSVVGTIGTLFVPIPLLAKQAYMVWVGIIVAYVFTWIPEWTSWVLLVLMALYDIAAVLIPGGPLKMLVELAIKRQQALPALIYESRPAGRYQGPDHWVRRAAADRLADEEAAAAEAAEGGRQTGAGGGSQSGRGPAAAPAAPASGRLGAPSQPVAEGTVVDSSPGSISSRVLWRPMSAGIGSNNCSGGGGNHEGQELIEVLGADFAGNYLASGYQQNPVARGSAAVPGSMGGLRGRQPGAIAEAREWEELDSGPSSEPTSVRSGDAGGGAVLVGGPAAPTRSDPSSQPLLPLEDNRGLSDEPSTDSSRERAARTQRNLSSAGELIAAASSAAVAPAPMPPMAARGGAEGQQPAGAAAQRPDDDDDMDLPDGIKLGLGDFIFYSMLVGRAAMYDMMTVFAAYLGIMAGLGLTLLCLAIFQRALPALPFSIALGVLFYFVTRLSLEPFLVPLASHYLFF